MFQLFNLYYVLNKSITLRADTFLVWNQQLLGKKWSSKHWAWEYCLIMLSYTSGGENRYALVEWWLIEENKELGDEPAPVPFHPPGFSHEIIQGWKRVSAVGSQP